jgi:hypothetical protein
MYIKFTHKSSNTSPRPYLYPGSGRFHRGRSRCHFLLHQISQLPLLQLYFRSLVTGGLLQARCPLLYTVALAHLNAFLFSEGPAQQVSPVAQTVRVKGLIVMTE